MIRKLLILIAAALILGCLLCIFDRKGNAFSENPVPTITAATPILDGTIDTSLHLKKCYSIDQISAYCTTTNEIWSSNKGELVIKRWHFDDPTKMEEFLKPSSKLFIGAILSWQSPLKWDKDPDISDKTCWGAPNAVIFIKGMYIVRVALGCRLSDEQKKSYTRKIAQSIAKKL